MLFEPFSLSVGSTLFISLNLSFDESALFNEKVVIEDARERNIVLCAEMSAFCQVIHDYFLEVFEV